MAEERRQKEPLAESVVSLALKPEQRLRLFAHLFVYLRRLDSLPSVCEQQGEGAPLRPVADRLVHRGEDKREERVCVFSLQEVRAIKEMFTVFEQQYTQGCPSDKTSVLVNEHLVVWRLLIEEVEQHVNTKTESR